MRHLQLAIFKVGRRQVAYESCKKQFDAQIVAAFNKDDPEADHSSFLMDTSGALHFVAPDDFFTDEVQLYRTIISDNSARI